MRTFQLLTLALLATAARADLFTDITGVYAQFAPLYSGPFVSCTASGNPASCKLTGHYDIPPGSIPGSSQSSFDLDIEATASSSVTTATFHLIDFYPRNEAFQVGSSQVFGFGGFGDTVYLFGPKGQPAFAEFEINPFPLRELNNRFCEPLIQDNLQLFWSGSFTCDPNPPDARYLGDWALVQPILLGEPFTFDMNISQGMPLDLGNDQLAMSFDGAYSVSSIKLVGIDGKELTGLKYSTASGVKYSIDGATFVPEPASIVLLGTVLLLMGARAFHPKAVRNLLQRSR